MNYYTVPEALALLRIDQSSFFRYLKAEGITLQQDPHDKRRRLISASQLQHLATAKHITLHMPTKEQETATPAMLAHLERLEQELDALKRLGDLSMILASLDRIEDRLSRMEEQLQPRTRQLQSIPALPEHDGVTHPIIPTELPADSIPHYAFAKQVQLNERRVRDHITHGIGGDKLEAIIRHKPGRPREHEYWFSPDMQLQAKVYWRRHGIPFTENDQN